MVLYRDWVESSTLSGSGTSTAYSRIQELRPSRVWVATSALTAWIGGDCGTTREANQFACIAHNFDVGVTLRLRLGTDAQLLDASPTTTGVVLDVTFDAWQPVAGLGFDGFGTSLGGFPKLTDFEDYTYLTPYSLGAKYSFRYWRLDIVKSVANSAGNFAIGRLMLGLGLQTGVNIAFGWSLEWIDPSEVTRTEASLSIVSATKYRRLTLSWDDLSATEALGQMDDFARIVGSSRAVFLSIFPTAAQNIRYRTSVYGVPEKNGATSNPYHDVYAKTLTVNEIRS
jgi:hypothetical protein